MFGKLNVALLGAGYATISLHEHDHSPILSALWIPDGCEVEFIVVHLVKEFS